MTKKEILKKIENINKLLSVIDEPDIPLLERAMFIKERTALKQQLKELNKE